MLGALCILWAPSRALAQEENILESDEEGPGRNIDVEVGPKTSFQLGGALWLRASGQRWVAESSANRRGLFFDQFRISVLGEHGFDNEVKLKFSSQTRWWSYQFAIQHLWFGIELDEHHDIRLGIIQAPFGALPSISSGFWYSLNYYHGIEGDHDAGLQYSFKQGGFSLHLAYFPNEEYNSPTATNRWAPDLVISDDQENFERNQGNLRLAYAFGHGTDMTTEVGLSGQVGELPNQLTGSPGWRWAAALHVVGTYGKWNVYAQAARYEFRPNNPDGVDDRTVLMGFFSSTRPVAAKATTFVGGIKKYWNLEWWLFNRLTAYIEYSEVFKDEDEFRTSRLVDPGVVVQAGPFYFWVDVLIAQNAWFFNDSFDNSGPAEGAAENVWETRVNISLQWYF